MTFVDRSVRATASGRGIGRATAPGLVTRRSMGCIGSPEEITDLARSLTPAAFTTGQAVAIDGWTI